MQPVQDLTIDTDVSRTQYQFVLRDTKADEFTAWVPKLIDRLRRLPAITDVASDFQNDGLAAYIDVDRATAARFGISPATIDNALYDAFGQRIISTVFTQSNQYRVILEADPNLQKSLDVAVRHLPAIGHICHRRGAAVGGDDRSISNRRRCRSITSASSRR